MVGTRVSEFQIFIAVLVVWLLIPVVGFVLGGWWPVVAWFIGSVVALLVPIE